MFIWALFGFAALILAFAGGWLLGEALSRDDSLSDEFAVLTRRLARSEVECDRLRQRVVSLSSQIALDNQSGMITSDCDGS